MFPSSPAHGILPMSTTSLPTQSSDFAAWYGEVVRRAGLAENAGSAHARRQGAAGGDVALPTASAVWAQAY